MTFPSNMPPLHLIPALSGVRSRRHLVNIRRAEDHVKAASELVKDAIRDEVKLLSEETEEQLRTKVMLIEQASDELSAYVRRHQRTRIFARVAVLNMYLGHFQRMLQKQEEAKAKAAQT
ncbi:hypothetical protein P3342_002079 [Pyrenophora teres f. teres]|nr:hypothetical protein HRS9139_03036 [Pyrenophora teres f. teres]CAA9962428.1 hypothetical protein PTMSG1_05802 [Pyrenophora teres f. maculata]KAE8844619.1 hypothetical protein PTNB85_02884 [Pyrenophora teres f. teres]KAE8847181.1 hypothetical protein HRS9122_04088 [Pyrenophora teres f. teres]KAE8866234.1 hypothetical protein PTNB29_03381 [Pyrenophora teres f. teres]